MNWKTGVKILSVMLSVLCFAVVGIMYSKLNFIDTPYLVGGLVFLSPLLLFWGLSKKIK